jgi:hypothetical protein
MRVGKDRQRVLVLDFEELIKPLILNQTRLRACKTICDDENAENWTGHRLKLSVVTVDFMGEETRTIKISAPDPVPSGTPKRTAAPPKPKPREEQLELPFADPTKH